jgi:hypothetical protein
MSCDSVEGNFDEIRTQINQLNMSDPDPFILGFNTLFGQLEAMNQYTCTNQCASCFTVLDSATTPSCGVLSIEESSAAKSFTYFC